MQKEENNLLVGDEKDGMLSTKKNAPGGSEEGIQGKPNPNEETNNKTNNETNKSSEANNTNKPSEQKTYTQDEFNKVVGNKLSEAKKKQKQEIADLEERIKEDKSDILARLELAEMKLKQREEREAELEIKIKTDKKIEELKSSGIEEDLISMIVSITDPSKLDLIDVEKLKKPVGTTLSNNSPVKTIAETENEDSLFRAIAKINPKIKKEV